MSGKVDAPATRFEGAGKYEECWRKLDSVDEEETFAVVCGDWKLGVGDCAEENWRLHYLFWVFRRISI